MNISDLFYVKGRLSSVLFLNEHAIGAGIPISGADKSRRVQIGIGYSKITGGLFSEIHDNAIFIELNIINYSKKRNFRRGFNVGMIFLYTENGKFRPGINFGWIFGIL